MSVRSKGGGRDSLGGAAIVSTYGSQTVCPADRVKLGSLLAQIGRETGHVDLDIKRDPTPAAPISFE